MKKILLILLLTISFIHADSYMNITKTDATGKQLLCKQKSLELETVKQRGCCSWHGGVSGCSGGRVVCNDGTYSPSCTCAVPTSPLG